MSIDSTPVAPGFVKWFFHLNTLGQGVVPKKGQVP